MMDYSCFSDKHQSCLAEPLTVSGFICEAYRVKIYGKLHFLKKLKKEHEDNILFREALRKEFEIGFRLEHPNIVRYVSFHDDEILMEYVDGEDLLAFLKNHPTYFEDAEHFDKFVGQLLSALQYLHDNQVLHLDLKPENIMLTRIGCDVKVVDLGCCYSDTFVDSTGYTTQYAAPEQLAGRKVDVRTDIYAVGKILELLPHHPIYNKVIKRCLNKNPQDRYPSIADLKAALATKKIVRKNMMWVASITVVVFSFLLLSFVFKFSSVPNPAIKNTSVQEEADTIKHLIQNPQKSKNPTANPIVVQNSHPAVSAVRQNAKSLNWQKDMDAALDKAYRQTISSFCDSIFPSPTVGLAWKVKSTEFHHQVIKITSDFHAKYPEVEESLLFAYAENNFQSVVGYVFGKMQDNGKKANP
nr:serine/threonine-protein kinase [uncultured Prevotella sp.]